MVALLQTRTAIATAIAFQDSDNPETFFYVPTVVDGVPEETLGEFKVTYWGYGKPFLREREGQIASVIGWVIAGSAMLELSPQSRQQLIDRIRQQFEIQAPLLQPLPLSQIVAEPRIGQLAFPVDAMADLNFPETIEAGTPFNFLVSTGNRLFAQFARSQAQDLQWGSQPSLALILVGQAEFQTQPWEVTIEAELSRVWALLRKRFAAEITAAWVELKADDFDKWIRDLIRDRAIKLSGVSGEVDLERSQWHRFEIGRHLLEALNRQQDSPTNLIRVQPNPSGSASIWQNWKIWVNLIYGEKAIASSMYQSKISVSDRSFYPVPLRLNLVKCTPQTSEYFQDLGNPIEPCITAKKTEELRKRLKEEIAKQSKMAQMLYARLVSGEISQAQYIQAINRSAN